MVPDIRTLFLLIAVLCVVQSVGMLVLWTLNRNIPGIGAWAASNVLNAFTMALLPLQGLVDNVVWSVLVPNLCALAAAICFYAGTGQFLGLTSWKRISVIATLVWIPPYLYYLFVEDSLVARIVLAAAILTFLNGITGFILMRGGREGLRFSTRFTGAFFVLFAGVMGWRLLGAFIEPAPQSFFDGSTTQWVTVLVVACFAYLRAFGTILMINQRQTLEISERHVAQLHAEAELTKARREAEEQRALRQRQALVRDLHDGIGGITANLAMLASLGREEEAAEVREEMMRHIQTMALEGNREVRSLMNTLENGELHWTDWLRDLRDYSQNIVQPMGIRLNWDSRGQSSQPVIGDPTAAISLTRAVKEAVHNLSRHSKATEASIDIEFQNDLLEILVADNGCGLPEAPSRGRGLKNMKRRAEELGGTLSVSADAGTRLRFSLPLPLKYPESGLAVA